MRYFFGIPLSRTVKDMLVPLAKEVVLGCSAKMVERDNLHITLRFLGDAEPDSITSQLEDFELDPFTVQLSGVGAFPDTRRPRVIWVGVSSGSEELIQLHNRLTRKLGLKPDRFHPHVTLARIKSGNPELPDPPEFEPFEVSKFNLFSSTLTPSGPIYKKIESYPT